MDVTGIAMVSQACLDCMCSQCAKEVRSCFATGSTDDQRTCRDIAVCRLQTWCVGLDCYTPMGPCMKEVEAAGMSTSLVTLIARGQSGPSLRARFARRNLLAGSVHGPMCALGWKAS